ncbi:hypothetical protein ACHAWF_013270 [Thalassiosira exigua]
MLPAPFPPVFVSVAHAFQRHAAAAFHSSASHRAFNFELKATPLNVSGGDERSRRRKSKRKRAGRRPRDLKRPNELETWRIYGVGVSPNDLPPTSRGRKNTEDCLPPERSYLTPPAVLASLLSRLRIRCDEPGVGSVDSLGSLTLPSQLKDARVVRRSLDARRRKGSDPKFTYVIDVVLTRASASSLRLSHQPGRSELVFDKKLTSPTDEKASVAGTGSGPNPKPKILIVGAGPAGLFCALSLALSGLFTPIILERGQPVEARGKSIGALIHRRDLDPESNFSFGEGGAGTWSDGKLTTRIGRNSGAVRFVLETLIERKPPFFSLDTSAPHLGTDNLVRLLRNMRQDLISLGGTIHFGARGVDAECASNEARAKHTSTKNIGVESFAGDAVVLAAGHSARDIYYEVQKAGVQLEAKGFAVGFRVEHPQSLINEIQYGNQWGSEVFTGRLSTDSANAHHFASDQDSSVPHNGTLPVASYRLATDQAFDGSSNRGAYSFCQCPGGQIVPSSTDDSELCINGMSFSNRDSLWANSALVVTVQPDDIILEPYRRNLSSNAKCLAGIEFQREMERRAFMLGGGGMRAPVQRLTDFVNKHISETIPQSSYRLGVKPANLHDLYPSEIYEALRFAVIHHFDKQMPGFLCDEALLHGVETRTSSPVRVVRDSETLQANVENLYPSGEGAGFAGGIVSAAVDGLMVANAIKEKFLAGHNNSQLFESDSKNSVGFDY